MKFQTINLDSGAKYQISWDDHCVVLKVNQKSLIWIEPKLLPKLMDFAYTCRVAELNDLLKRKHEKNNK